MNAWLMKAIFIAAAVLAVITIYRCAATLVKRRTK